MTLAAVMSGACGDGTAEPLPEGPLPPLYYLKAPTNSGDGQTDTVLATLANPFRVLVRRGDTPAPGVIVLWETGADTVRHIPGVSIATVTDSTGIASYRLTLGSAAYYTYAIRARVPGVIVPAPVQVARDLPCGSALCFTATALAATPTELEYVSGDGQTRPVNTPLAADYVVRLTDSYGNGVGGVVIDWAVTAGGGSITPAQATTAPFTGVARARATLGPSDGSQTVTATASALQGVPQVIFTATAFDPGPVADINGIWDWTEEYTNPFCADTGSYVFTQTGSAFSGSSQQVGVCYTSSGQRDNTTGPDPVVNGFVAGDTVTFLVPIVDGSCTYYATASGNPPDSVSGTTQCRNNTGTRITTGTWKAVRERQVASVTVTPGGQTLPKGDTLQLAAQLRDVDGNRVFFRPVTWSSDNPAVASVSPAGIVLAVSAGSATITASAGGQNGTATVLVP